MTTSAGLSIVYVIIFGFYAYAFYFGAMMRWSPDKWFINDYTNERYTGGEIMGIIFMILFGIFQLTAIGPNLKALTEGKIGAKLAYDTIDHIPLVNPKAKGGSQLQNPQGQINFENVEFTYPTRKDLKVLKSLTCSFDAGKTTAIVGPSGSGKSTIIQMVERFYRPNGGTITIDG
jgi:ABC-type multidrug transport system fused ATPase/permease subunit